MDLHALLSRFDRSRTSLVVAYSVAMFGFGLFVGLVVGVAMDDNRVVKSIRVQDNAGGQVYTCVLNQQGEIACVSED